VRATTREITVSALARKAGSDSPVVVKRLGDDVRAHVVGDGVPRPGSAAPPSITARTARPSGGDSAPRSTGRPAGRRTADQGLLFAGSDFKVNSAGTAYQAELRRLVLGRPSVLRRPSPVETNRK
jgi:hypothetical protein